MRRTNFQFHVGEVVKVGCVIDGSDFDGYRCGSFADVLPIDAPEKRYQLQFFQPFLRP